MAPPLKPIDPKAPRWEPSADPSSIVVPGLDTSASVNDQIEQIEQLITIKLQNIDANFSKMQQIMANRILPAVKRYGVATEPVREAAKFWTTFFEQAAQIRVPTYEEYSGQEETETEQQTEDASASEQPSADGTSQDVSAHPQSFNPDRTSNTESSFMPGDAAVSSTPATARHKSQYDTFLSADGQMPSWSASIESPLVRLDRELQSLREDDVSVASSSVLHQDAHDDESQEITQRQIPPPVFDEPSRRGDASVAPENNKGKGKEVPLRNDVLRRNVDASSTSMRSRAPVSPLKVKGRTPIIKARNPYLPPDTKPSDWKGVVDLKDPSVATPRRTQSKARFAAGPSSTKRSTTPGVGPDDDLDDDLDASLAMSPPVTLAFAKLPKATTPKLGKTPRKQAAARIMKDLLDVEKRLGMPSGSQQASASARGGPAGTRTTESSLLSVPTPPSLSRYNRHPYPAANDVSASTIADASLESMMRRVGLEGYNYRAAAKGKTEDVSSVSSSLPSIPSGNAYARPSLNQAVYSSASAQGPGEAETPRPPVFSYGRLVDDELTDPNANADDSFDDSLDYDDNDAEGANPAAAFFQASQQGVYEDPDSFSSEGSSDSMGSGGGAVHPFARAMSASVDGADEYDDDDDSFDDADHAESTQEETLFGVPPAQRLAQQAAQARRMAEGHLRMHGQELLEDTIGMGAHRAQDETPTPWGR